MKKIALMVFIVFFIGYAYTHSTPEDYIPNCAIENGSCVKRTGSIEIVSDINPKPVKAMRELTFSLSMKGSVKDDLILDLSMPGMYMGKNEVVLKRTEDGIFIGKGVIPRCPSGKRLWRAKIIDNGNVIAEFLFNVSY